MEGPSEWVPDVQLKQEVMSDESTEYGGYRTDLGQGTKLHVKSEFRQKQPVVFLEKLDLTSFKNGTYHTSDLQNSPVPFQGPHVDYEEEPDADFRDNPGESAPLERKYVTSSLLSRIKIEEAEEDGNPKSELVNKSAILRLVLKQESDIGSSTNEPSDSRPEIERQGETVTVTGKSKEDDTHREISDRNSNMRKNPVVLLERLDPILVRYHSKPSDSASSSSSFQLKTEGGSGVDHGSVHNHIPENDGIDNKNTGRMSVSVPELSLQKEQKVSKMKAVDTVTSNKDTNKLHLKTTNKSASRNSLNPPNNTNSSSLRGHVKDGHNKDETFSCDMRSETFNSINSPKEHLRILHNNEQHMFLRNQCPSTFKEKDILYKDNSHIHSNDPNFACTQCSRKFELKKDLQIHKESVHNNERPFPCGQCSKTFKFSSALRVHARCVHREIRPFSCDQCGRKFKLKGNLKRHGGSGLDHVFVHNHVPENQGIDRLSMNTKFLSKNKRKTSKTKDPETFTSTPIKENIRVPTPEKSAPTRDLNSPSNASTVLTHLSRQNKYPPDERKLKSETADRHTNSDAQISANVQYSRPHTSDQLSPSSEYSPQVQSKPPVSSPVMHMDEDRPFSCVECSRKFTSRAALRRHVIRRHNGDEIFFCEKCSVRFKSNVYLQAHLRNSHDSERPSCSQSSSPFESKHNLCNRIIHIRSNDRNFACTQCSRLQQLCL
nr:PREDICTED: zinc finger protein 37-like [Bemisia tabaci]